MDGKGEFCQKPVTYRLDIMIVNGEKLDLQSLSEPSLQALLLHFELDRQGIAIEYNGQILPKSKWDDLVLHEDDRLELIRFVGGG